MNTFFRNSIALLQLLTAAFISFNSSGQTDRFNVDSIKGLVGQLSSDSEKVKAYIDLASVMYCEDSNNKIIIATEAKKLAENIKWHKGIYNANRKLGEIYFSCLRNYPKAFEYFRDNVDAANRFHDTLNEAKALETIAKSYKKIVQLQLALEYFEKVLALSPDADMQMGVLGDMGVVYNTIGDHSHALASYTTSLHILDSLSGSKTKSDIEDTQQKAGLLLDIGDIYLSMLQPDKAFESYDKANDIGVALNDIGFQVKGLTGIGKTYRLKNDYPRAIEYYQNALNKCHTTTHFRDEVKILNEMANTYLDTWIFDKALAFADSSRRLAEDQSYLDLLAKPYTTLGNVYLKQNKYDLAIPYLQKALSISQKTNILDDEKDAWFSLISAFEHSGQPEKALDAYRNYINIRDSVYSIAKSNELIRKDLEYSFQKQQIADSVRQESVYGKKIERQRTFTYSVFIGLVLVVLLAFFILRNYNIQKKYNELLSREKKSHLAHIEAQSNVLSDIAHIQAHQVRGPVATILGLVQLFNYNDPTDPVNKEVMEGLGTVTEKLDTVVKEVILKENRLRYGKDK